MKRRANGKQIMDHAAGEDRERLKLFKKYGYDMRKAGAFILNKAAFGRGTVLDIGTGRDHTALALAEKGFHLTSIDLDRKAQALARACLRAGNLDSLVRLRIMDAERLRFKDDGFDYVISVNFLHHAEHPARCLKEMARVAGEKLVISDLNKNGVRVMEKMHAREGRRHPPSRMSLREAKELLERSGLKVKTYRDTCQTVLVAVKRKTQ